MGEFNVFVLLLKEVFYEVEAGFELQNILLNRRDLIHPIIIEQFHLKGTLILKFLSFFTEISGR